jgi:integrase
MASIKQTRFGTWEVMIRRKGYAPQYRSFRIREEAEEWAAATELEMTRGEFVCRKEGEKTTIREAFERYVREVTPHKKGWKQEISRIRQWQADALSRRPLSGLRGMDVSKWRDGQIAAGLAPQTVKHRLNLLSHLYTIARKEWGMEYLTNPVEAVRKPRLPQGRDRRLLPGEEDRLLEMARPELRAFVVLALETAMRRGELANLRREWIRGNVAILPDTKNGASRAVPLSSRARATLALLPARVDGQVFGYGESWFTHEFVKLCRVAGINGLRLHDLRHEATSRLFEKGLALMEVASITGHKSLSQLQRYTHLAAHDLAAKLG